MATLTGPVNSPLALLRKGARPKYRLVRPAGFRYFSHVEDLYGALPFGTTIDTELLHGDRVCRGANGKRYATIEHC